MKISVIIPTLDEENRIRRAIESAKLADEIIVVDGGSRDSTVSIAEAAGAKLVRAPQGRGVQLRTGAELARGNILLLLHADSWLALDAVQELRRFALGTAGETVYGCFRQRIDDPAFRYRILESGNAWRATALGMPYGDQAVFVDRNTYDAVHGIDEVPLMEDVLFSKRLRSLGRPTLLEGPVNLSARRWKQSGVIRQTLKNWTILTAFWLGVSPTRLARWYR